MILESSFFKLPELLTSNYDHRDTFEATVAHLFSIAVFMELNSRNVPRPFEHVFIEKPYPTLDASRKAIHSDLLFRLQGAVPTTNRQFLYGVREQNWIEVKGFFGSTRGTSSPPKTRKIGAIFRDILRLCLLPDELIGEIRQNGRYILIVGSTPPDQWLAFNRSDGPRVWLINLFSEGDSVIEFDLENEPESLCRGVGEGFVANPELSVSINVRTRIFEPFGGEADPLFWGHLVRIGNFLISSKKLEVEFRDEQGFFWTEDHQLSMNELRKDIINRLASTG